MALVTFLEAKAHLLVDDDDHNADIALKLEQASAIVLDYLKTRSSSRVGTITSSSVANPTVITMAAAHPFNNGDTVTIAGHLTSVPSLTGSHVISNVTNTTFTIPVNVTTAGTDGTATATWSVTTVPRPVQAAVLLALSHLYEHRGNDMMADEALWKALERLLVRFRDPALA